VSDTTSPQGNADYHVPDAQQSAGYPKVYEDVRDERKRAHEKHRATSMEAFPPDDMNRLAILTEEVGEVAKEFNEARHYGRDVDLGRLRKELVQTAAMAVAWADAILLCSKCGGDGWTAEHEPDCDGSCARTHCPIQVQCSWCQATGYEWVPPILPEPAATEEVKADVEPF
jgi:NTP pyrophosphatase (non-canonical NTP hydrolase)